MKPTIYIHHDVYQTIGPHLHLVNAQHREERYPESAHGYFTFYQYFIETDGETIHTRPDMDPLVVYKPAHENSISICLAGNLDHSFPTDLQLLALDTLIDRLATQYDINSLNIKEHRDYQATSCPGAMIPRGYFARRYISRRLQGVQKALEHIKLLVLQLRGK